jgi:hypothetical protein
MTLAKPSPAAIDTALEALTDASLTVEDRAGAYAVLHQVQLRIRRALGLVQTKGPTVKDEIITYMVQNKLKALGPLTIASSAEGVQWPVNAEGNWLDATVQDTIRDVIRPVAPEFVRHVPEHFEIRTAELGAAVHAGDPVAMQLHAELKVRGWRTEESRRLSLAVKEVKSPKEEAA